MRRPGIRTGEEASNEGWLLWSLLFGSIGLGYFIYGKRQRAPIPSVCGIGPMVFPSLVSSTWMMLLVGAALLATAYFSRIPAGTKRVGASQVCLARGLPPAR
jgi:hypothetical protein